MIGSKLMQELIPAIELAITAGTTHICPKPCNQP